MQIPSHCIHQSRIQSILLLFFHIPHSETKVCRKTKSFEQRTIEQLRKTIHLRLTKTGETKELKIYKFTKTVEMSFLSLKALQ